MAAEVLALKGWLREEFERAEAGDQLLLAELLARSLERAGRLLTDISRLRLEERRVQITQRQGDLLIGVIRNVLGDAGVDPASPDVRSSLRRHLTAVRDAEAEREHLEAT